MKWLARPILLGLATVLLIADKWQCGYLDPLYFKLVAGGWAAFWTSREVEKRRETR